MKKAATKGTDEAAKKRVHFETSILVESQSKARLHPSQQVDDGEAEISPNAHVSDDIQLSSTTPAALKDDEYVAPLPVEGTIPGAVAIPGVNASSEESTIGSYVSVTHGPPPEDIPVSARVVETDGDTVGIRERVAQLEQQMLVITRGAVVAEDVTPMHDGGDVEEAGGGYHEEAGSTCGWFLNVRTKKRTMFVAIGLLVVALFVVIVVLLVGHSGDSESKTRTEELIRSESLDGGDALSDATSAQSRALVWLQNNINLGSYPDWRLIQRYVLAVLYFSTNGIEWTINNGWLSDREECGWYSDSYFGPLCKSGRITNLFLNENNLTGIVPLDLAMLSNSLGKELQSLNVSIAVDIMISHFYAVFHVSQFGWISATMH